MWKNSIVALVTPFDSKGKVDFEALERLIDHQIQGGTDSLLLCGSTGEGSTLCREEKLEIFRVANRVAGGSIPLIAATGSNHTEESVVLTEKAMKIGMEGCIAIVPYYNKPTPEGCIRHFAALSEVGLPLFVYHHPGRTGVKLSAETLAEIAALEGVVGIKEASGDLQLAQDLLKMSSCPLFSGDDTLALPQLAVGFAGSISIIGNVVPNRWKKFVETATSGDIITAREMYRSLYSLVQALVLETNPQCVKYATSLLRLCSPRMRLPLIEPSEKVRARLLDELRDEPRPAGLVASP